MVNIPEQEGGMNNRWLIHCVAPAAVLLVFSIAAEADDPSPKDPNVIASSHSGTLATFSQVNIDASVPVVRTSGYERPGDGGQATYIRVDREPAHYGKFQSADGSWWELREDVVRLEMFGGGVDKDGEANNRAFEAAQDYLSVRTLGPVDGAGPTIEFSYGDYRFARTIEIKRALHIKGKGAGHGPVSGQNTRLLFPKDTTGIVVHRPNTIADTVETKNSTGNRGADNSIIENLTLVSERGETPLPPDYNRDAMRGHGIWLRARAVIRNVYVNNFPRNGIHIRASARGAPHTAGNANLFLLERVSSSNNGWNGVYVDGPDVNAGLGIGVNATHNGLYGIFDSSFLGNTWIGCHTASNNKHGQVHYNGKRYRLVADDVNAGARTVPGADDSKWRFVRTGRPHPAYPDWSPHKIYVRGGPYRSDNRNARSVFLGCYSEGDQGGSYVISPSIIVGGLFGINDGNAGVYTSNSISAGTRVDIEGLRMVLGEPGNGTALKFEHPGTKPLRFRFNDGAWELNSANASDRRLLRFSTELTPIDAGRGSPIGPGFPIAPRGLFLGSGPRMITYGTSPPTSGKWGKGDIVFNQNPSPGGYAGWICTKGGTAGVDAVFKGFGRIEE